MQTAESFNAERTGRIEIILDPAPPVLQKTSDEDVDKEFHILPMPPIPSEAWKFIEEAELAAQGMTVIRSQGKDYGKDAGTNEERKS